MRRYLAISGAIALVVNVAINLVVGSAIYKGHDVVPLTGDSSIAGDTVVGAFLIAFFTLLVVPQAARREVRAGHIRAGGWGLPRRRWLTAIAGGVISAIAIGIPATLIVGGPLSHDAFLAFKVGFAGAWGALAAMLVAYLAAASEPVPAPDPRWVPGAAGDAFDYIDKGGLAVTSEARGCSGTPTWQLVVRGALDPDRVRAALSDVLARYPSAATRVRSLDAVADYATRFVYAPVDPGDIFEVVDGDVDAIVRAQWNRHCDLFRDPPLTLTMVRDGERTHLLFRQHHAIADGRAFIELLQDFARYLAGGGDRTPIPRRGELEPLGLSRGKTLRYGMSGFGSLIWSVGKAIVRPLALLAQNESRDYTGANNAIRWQLADDVLPAWKDASKRHGVSLNSLLTGAWFVANQRYEQAHGRKLGWTSASLVMETRPRDGRFRSFANHLATLEAEVPMHRALTPAQIVQRVHAQVANQLASQRPFKRLVCERALVRGMPLDKLQALVFEAKRPAFNLNFSNLIPLDWPVMQGDGWKVEEVLITTPVTPRNGVVLTVIRYNGTLCFNFNHAVSAASVDQAAELRRLFEASVSELASR